MIEGSAWARLVRAIEVHEPVLPALRPYLLRLRSLIAEHSDVARRDVRRRRAARVRPRSVRRTRRSSRAA